MRLLILIRDTVGGTMPCEDLFLWFQQQVEVLDRWTINGQNYGKGYSIRNSPRTSSIHTLCYPRKPARVRSG